MTLGIIPPKRITDKERQYDRDWQSQYVVVDRPIRDYRGYRKETETYFLEGTHELKLSQSGNTPKRQSKPRGQKGITSHGKRMVRNGAYILQKRYGKKRLGFLTLTLPSLRIDHIVLLAMEWSELVRQFNQELTREINRSGKPALFVGCTEIQTKRLKKYGQFAPHLHLVYVAHDGDYNWYVKAEKLRAIWKRVIEARLKYLFPDEEIQVDTSASVDTQLVKRKADSYLSKYLSKGQKEVQEIIDMGWGECIPSAWWHCCHKLKKVIKSMVVELPSGIKRAVIEGVDLVSRGVMYYLHEVERDNRRYGWVGKLKPFWVKDIVDFRFDDSFV